MTFELLLAEPPFAVGVDLEVGLSESSVGLVALSEGGRVAASVVPGEEGDAGVWGSWIVIAIVCLSFGGGGVIRVLGSIRKSVIWLVGYAIAQRTPCGAVVCEVGWWRKG